MDIETIDKLSKLLTGLKRYEWSRIKVAVERMYDSASNKIALDDTESIQKNISLEMGELVSNQ